jgi:hypothetical protein
VFLNIAPYGENPPIVLPSNQTSPSPSSSNDKGSP